MIDAVIDTSRMRERMCAATAHHGHSLPIFIPLEKNGETLDLFWPLPVLLEPSAEVAMRYVKQHKHRTRKRIIENASYGLREKGAEGLSVVDLMKLAGLTHGGFYSHFESREDLVSEATVFAMDRTTTSWTQLMKGLPVEQRFDAITASYLSSHHRDNPERGCALPALGADIGRSNPSTRLAFEDKLEKMIDLLAQQLPGDSPQHARQVAIGTLATLIGSIVLARAVSNRALSNLILDAGRKTVGRPATKSC